LISPATSTKPSVSSRESTLASSIVATDLANSDKLNRKAILNNLQAGGHNIPSSLQMPSSTDMETGSVSNEDGDDRAQPDNFHDTHTSSQIGNGDESRQLSDAKKSDGEVNGTDGRDLQDDSAVLEWEAEFAKINGKAHKHKLADGSDENKQQDGDEEVVQVEKVANSTDDDVVGSSSSPKVPTAPIPKTRKDTTGKPATDTVATSRSLRSKGPPSTTGCSTGATSGD